MKNFLSIFILLAFFVLSGSEYDVYGGFYTAGGKMIKAGKNGFNLVGKGVKINASDISLDGLDHSITVPHSEKINSSDGMTVFIKCRWRTMPENSDINKRLDIFAFKEDQFVFARHDDRIYINFFNGKKWGASTYSGHILPKSDGADFHTVVMTVKRHKVVDQGEDWLEVTAWFDGKIVISRRIPEYNINISGKMIELASGKKFGKPWSFGGDIAEIQVFDRTLGPAAIRKLCKYQAVKYVYPKGRNIVMHGVKSKLTLLESKDFVHPVSLYDNIAKREIFANGSRFFSVDCRKGQQSFRISPLTDGMKSSLSVRPQLKNGIWTFSIAYSKKAVLQSPVTFDAVCDFTYFNDRLEYTLNIKNVENGRITDVFYPDLQFKPLKKGTDYLLVPQMCGVAHKNAAERNICYSEVYPRGMASMQCGAFYDDDGGVYVSPGDPEGLVKTLNYSASEDTLDAFTVWEVHNNKFQNKSRAAVEIFRGNWYDAGLIYRAEQERNNSMWWVKSLAAVDTPQWMRNSTWSMNITFPYVSEKNIIKIAKYFEAPPSLFVQGWWELGGNELGPNIRPTPEILEFYRVLQQNGIRITPYINGRLWPKYDRQGEDFEYTKYGVPAAVRKNGEIVMENYSKTPCVVLCPATETYQKRIPAFALKIAAHGADGVYVDQIGAASAPVCTSKEHGHTPGDLKFWYTNGHYPVYNSIRKNPLFKDKILSTEDHSETCVGIFDTMLPWRWLYNDMVPLFPMVFSGRTQFYGRDSAAANAPFAKTAMMLNNGEQLGWYNHIIFSPLSGDLRRFVKRMIHSRIAMLPFFNEGMMARPPRYVTAVPFEKKYWGTHGDKFITMPCIQTSMWQKGDDFALIIVNTSGKKLSGALEISLPQKQYQAKIYSSFADPSEYEVKNNVFQYEIPAYANQIVYMFPVGKCNNIIKKGFEKSFEIIRKTLHEKDPFKFNSQLHPYKGRVMNPFEWQDCGKSYYISGAQKQPGGGLFWIANCIAGAGKYNFGEDCKGFEIELVRMAGFVASGKIRFCVNGIEEKDTVAEIFIDSSVVQSASLKDWKKVEVKLKRQLKGEQLLYIVFDGFSFCNVKNWRAVK